MLKDSGHDVFQAGKGGFKLKLYGFDEAQCFAQRGALFANRAWTIVAVVRGDRFGAGDLKCNLMHQVL